MIHPLRLGFLIPGNYDRPGENPAAALEESIELSKFGEKLGYDLAAHRVRHFERALTGVFPYLGAVARETSRIRLGTATVPIANESPIRLAEDAATADLLSGGRIELGVGAGHGGRLLPLAFAQAYEQEEPIGPPRTDRVLRRFLRALEGAQMAQRAAGEFDLQFARPEEGLRVHPHVESLRWRVSYGTGSRTSTIRAGELGLGLQLANFGRDLRGQLIPGEAGPAQIPEIEQYIEAWAQQPGTPGRPARGKITVSRIAIPYETNRQRARLSRIVGDQAAFERAGGFFGPPSLIADRLGRDPAITMAREYNEATLLVIIPFYLGSEETRELLAVLANTVVPQLGWEPATAAPAR